jgi:hypothetical protein
MKQKTNQLLFAYWNEVRGERMAPRRFEIEPGRIAQILSETFILERIDHETYPFRLAGTKISDQFGTEMRGTNFLADWIEEDHLALSNQLDSVCKRGGVLVFDIEAAADQRRRASFEITVMPLIHTGETVTRLVGAISAIDPPAWLGDARLWRKRILTHEIIWPEGRPHIVAEKWREHAPILTTLASARLVRRERRAFHVIDGGRPDKPDKSN